MVIEYSFYSHNTQSYELASIYQSGAINLFDSAITPQPLTPRDDWGFVGMSWAVLTLTIFAVGGWSYVFGLF